MAGAWNSPALRGDRSVPGRLPACSQGGQRAFLHLPEAQQLGSLSSLLWLALGWGRGPMTGGQRGAQQVSRGLAQGLHGSLRSQAGTVPPNARPPLETPDVPGRAEGTTRVRTPWGPRPGKGAPSAPGHRVDVQNDRGTAAPGPASILTVASRPSLGPRLQAGGLPWPNTAGVNPRLAGISETQKPSKNEQRVWGGLRERSAGLRAFRA